SRLISTVPSMTRLRYTELSLAQRTSCAQIAEAGRVMSERIVMPLAGEAVFGGSVGAPAIARPARPATQIPRARRANRVTSGSFQSHIEAANANLTVA